MGKIDTSVRRTLRELEGHAKRSITSGIVNSWNQYQVVSIEKWERLVKKKPRLGILLKYMPEQYLEGPLGHHHRTGEEEKQVDKWYSDWSKFLEERKDPKLGRLQCSNCLLHPDATRFDASLHGVMLKGLDVEFPCGVVNYFKCPFENNKELFYLKYIMECVKDAISHSERATDSMDETHYAYPSRSFVENFMNLHQSGKPNGWGPDSFLGEEETTKVPIRDTSDKFKVLTDKKLLGTLLEEYVRYLRKGTAYGSAEYTKEKAETVNDTIPDILHYFSSIKSKIEIDELRDSHGRNLAEEKIERKRIADMYDRLAQKDDSMRQNMLKPRNGLCMACKEFANILCMECDKWICAPHYNEHKISIHKN